MEEEEEETEEFSSFSLLTRNLFFFRSGFDIIALEVGVDDDDDVCCCCWRNIRPWMSLILLETFLRPGLLDSAIMTLIFVFLFLLQTLVCTFSQIYSPYHKIQNFNGRRRRLSEWVSASSWVSQEGGGEKSTKNLTLTLTDRGKRGNYAAETRFPSKISLNRSRFRWINIFSVSFELERKYWSLKNY